MRGAIIVNGYYESKPYANQAERIKDEFSLRDIHLDIIKNNKALTIGNNFDFDFVIFLDKDIYLARMLEQVGVVVFNNSFAIESCDDKILTAISLNKHKDIIMPKTVISPLKYKEVLDSEFIQQLECSFDYPIIAKKAKGSLGCDVLLINNRQELEKTEKEWSTTPHLYQVFVEESKGKTVRAYVVGNKVVASMLLTSEEDFRSNAQGNKAEKVELDQNYIQTAESISRYLELDFCAIDFCVGAALVLEVNSNAFFERMEEISGVNIAGNIADYVIGFLREIKVNE